MIMNINRKKTIIFVILHIIILVFVFLFGKIYATHQTKTNHYLLNANINIDIIPRAKLYFNKHKYFFKTYNHDKTLSKVFLYQKNENTKKYKLKKNIYFYVSQTNTYLENYFNEYIMDRDITGGVNFHTLYVDKIQTHHYKGFKSIDNKQNNLIKGIYCIYKNNFMIILDYDFKPLNIDKDKNTEILKNKMNKMLNRFTGID